MCDGPCHTFVVVVWSVVRSAQFYFELESLTKGVPKSSTLSSPSDGWGRSTGTESESTGNSSSFTISTGPRLNSEIRIWTHDSSDRVAQPSCGGLASSFHSRGSFCRVICTLVVRVVANQAEINSNPTIARTSDFQIAERRVFASPGESALGFITCNWATVRGSIRSSQPLCAYTSG